MKLIIQTKNDRGEYKTRIKEVHSERHAQNYEALLIRKGVKIIGTHVIR